MGMDEMSNGAGLGAKGIDILMHQLGVKDLDSDTVSLSKGGGLAANPRREREKSATKTCVAIVHEDAELGGREPLLSQHGCQRKVPDETCVAVDD